MRAVKSLSHILAGTALALALAACSTGPKPGAQAPAAPVAASPAQSQVQRADLARGLYEIAYSPRLDAVFVASSGGFGKDAAASKVLRLDPATLTVVNEIPLERKGFGVALDDKAGRLYVGNTVDTSVTVVDVNTNQVVGLVQLMNKVKDSSGKERYSHDLRELVVDASNHHLYVTGHSDKGSVLFVVDTRTLKVKKTIPGLGNQKAPGLVLDAAGKRVFTSNLLGEIVVVDTRTLSVKKRYKTSAEQPMNLVYEAKTHRLFATDQGAENIRKYQANVTPSFSSQNPGNRVVVFDANTGKEIQSIPTDAGPLAIKLDERRGRLYVTNRTAGKVSVYDSTTYALLQTFSVPDLPNSLALDEARNILFVTIKNGKDQPKDAKESVARIALP